LLLVLEPILVVTFVVLVLLWEPMLLKPKLQLHTLKCSEMLLMVGLGNPDHISASEEQAVGARLEMPRDAADGSFGAPDLVAAAGDQAAEARLEIVESAESGLGAAAEDQVPAVGRVPAPGGG
jgi:hypothetical protein